VGQASCLSKLKGGQDAHPTINYFYKNGMHPKKTPNSIELGVLQKLKTTALEAHSLALGGRRSREF
jgi:hypothetical protein